MASLGASALVSFGAVQTSFVVQVERNKYYEMDLAKVGVPQDARILRRIYTGQSGDLTALEWHGNAPPLRFPGTTLRFLGLPFGEVPVSSTSRLAINVVWVRSEDTDEWSYLVTAFEATAAGDYAPSLVFAQSAAEISMMPMIKQRLRRHVARDRVENFMKDSLTYGHALNVLLPYISSELGAPKMPDEVRGALNNMRKKRNHIIHEGAQVAAITPEDAMEGLCAAAFGFEYMRYVGPSLLKEGK